MAGLNVSAVIPAYNERQAIASVVQSVREALARSAAQHEVIVIDDGSEDGTGEAARAAGATVIRHPVNSGYGRSLDTGIGAAKHEWVLMTDGDGSYPASEIGKLLEAAEGFDLVVGARTGSHFWGSSFQALRRVVYLQIARFVSGVKVPDANSGLRLVRRELAAAQGPVRCLGYSYTTTMTLIFLQSGRFVKFVPIEYHARVGSSKVRPVRDTLRTLQIMAQVIIAYNPLKLFVTMAGLFAAAGLAGGGVYARLGSRGWLIAAVLSGLLAFESLLVGCVLDAMRMRRRP